jgi:hypothetical protein
MRGGVFGPEEKGCCSPTNITQLLLDYAFPIPTQLFGGKLCMYVCMYVGLCMYVCAACSTQVTKTRP